MFFAIGKKTPSKMEKMFYISEKWKIFFIIS